jgi:hypothetical protein
MSNLMTTLQDVQGKAVAALAATERDEKASPVLTAVVREFVNKAGKALELTSAGRPRDAVVELEQAGDSAKAAAEADAAAADATTSAVLDAHLAICMLKANLDPSSS